MYLQAVQGSLVRSMVYGVKHAINNGAQTLSLARDDWEDPGLPDRLTWVADLMTDLGQVLAGFDRLYDWTVGPQLVPELLAEVTRFQRMQTRLVTTAVQSTVQPSLPPIRTSPGRALTALLVVVTNAKEALGTVEGRIELWADGDEQSVRLRVEDAGGGIAGTVLPRLFEAGVTTKDAPHHGLGLLVARSLVRETGGDLIVDNRAEGGCRATLTFPAWQSRRH